MAVQEKITIYGAKLCFRNFSGKPSEYNAEGDRNACIILNDEQAEELAQAGWPVKVRPPREDHEDEGNFNFMKFKVKYGANPNLHPKIYRIVNGKQVLMTERTLGALDYDVIENVDVRLRPFNYKPGKCSAYVDTMYVTVEDDPLAAKYATEPVADFIDSDESPFT